MNTEYYDDIITGEVISTVQMVMQAQMPYTVLRDGVLTHPTMAEGLNMLFSKF